MIQKLLLLFSILSIIQTNIVAQETNDTIRCNFQILSMVDEATQLSNNLAYLFLMTFDDSCKNNIEYSEWSNELLFNFLDKQPEMFFNILDGNNEINKSIILRELKNPIHDGIDLGRISKNLKYLPFKSVLKDSVIKILNYIN